MDISDLQGHLLRHLHTTWLHDSLPERLGTGAWSMGREFCGGFTSYGSLNMMRLDIVLPYLIADVSHGDALLAVIVRLRHRCATGHTVHYSPAFESAN